MTDRTARRWAWAAFLFFFANVFVSIVFGVLAVSGPGGGLGGDVPFALIIMAFPVVALLILSRQPRNVIGWILMAIGIGWVIGPEQIGDFLISRGHVQGGALAIALSGPTWAPPVVLMGTSLLLRFPDGRLLSSRWKKVEWIALGTLVVVVLAILFSPGDLSDSGYPDLTNPLGVEALRPMLNVALVTLLLIPAMIIASAVSLVVRFRRSSGTERLQLKWLATAAAALAIVYLLAMVVSINYAWLSSGTPGYVGVIQAAATFAFVLPPVAIGFAVLKYRLYDIDVVINKSVVYGVMGVFITAVYVAIVVGIGNAIGSERNLGLSILATALVAVGFQPVRERVQRLANRLVYGKRATPYEVLSEFSGRMSHAVATEELLPRMARIAAEGTGAAAVDVWLYLGGEFVREASWPPSDAGPRSAPPTPDGGEPTIGGADAVVAVRHQGELLGAIGLTKARGEAVRPEERKLLEDLASQAGLVLRNVRLIEDLRTSRQRLVTAQDEERRRLERDLHDGAQQRLVAIALILRLARGGVDPDQDPDLAHRIDQAAEEMARALAELREFARGIHPAILTERGLVPALESLAVRSAIPADVRASIDDRLPATIEATAYFVVSEALANAAKYARATSVAIRARIEEGSLVLEVADDGVGGADPARGSGLRGLSDRVAVVDGTLEIRSPVGEGTTLRCRIPVPAARAAADSAGAPLAMAAAGDGALGG